MVENSEPVKMEYRYFGNTGIRVSCLAFGLWDYTCSTEIVRKALDSGINFFDTAEQYFYGKSEQALGKALKEANAKREHIVVCTKLMRMGSKLNLGYLSRKHIIEGIRNSLRNLQLDYVDIVLCHRPDMHAPLEETCRAMSWIVDKGYALYWGTSEWPTDRTVKAIEICKRYGLNEPCIEQPEYSMLVRNYFEKDMRRIWEEYRMGACTFTPLNGGILSGKYNDGTQTNDGRFGKNKANPYIQGMWDKHMAGDKGQANIRRLQGLGALAKELGYT